MRRARRTPSGNLSAGNSPVSTSTTAFDPQRRTELLVEARRKRVAWVEEARGLEEGLHGARKRRENQAAENGRKAEGELERLFPSAVKFHDFLSGLAGDTEESPAGDLSAILQPFMVQDIDIGDDMPIPSHREGARAYDVFLDKLRHPRAAEVVKSLQQFVSSFKSRVAGNKRRVAVVHASVEARPNTSGRPGPDWSGELSRSGSAREGVGLPPPPTAAAATVTAAGAAGAAGASGKEKGDGKDGTLTAASMSGMMHAFLGRVASQMRESVLWRRETETQWEETRECLERIVMHKVFEPAHSLAADVKRDEAIAGRLRSLSFLTEEHLGVEPLVDPPVVGGKPTWADAEEQLTKISEMRCPGDMLGCMIKCTRIVASILTGSQETGALPGADEFLPALILLVKRVNPPNIYSNLEFVQVYRDPSKLLSEAGYVLTQVVSAVCFLEDVDASVLSIAHGDFERGLKGFTENARVGLKAHQLQVKKEEEQVRAQESTRDVTAAGATAPFLYGVDDLTGSKDASSTASSPSGAAATKAPVSPPGPVALPEAVEPRTISPMEVRAERLAGRRSTRILLGDDHVDVFQTKHRERSQLYHETIEQSVSSSAGYSSQKKSCEGVKDVEHGFPGYINASSNGDDRSGHVKGQPLETLRFVGATVSDLKMSEVPALLAEHQRLARLCEELLAERGELLGLRRRRS